MFLNNSGILNCCVSIPLLLLSYQSQVCGLHVKGPGACPLRSFARDVLMNKVYVIVSLLSERLRVMMQFRGSYLGHSLILF